MTARFFCRSIATREEVSRAKEILKETGAEDIASAGETSVSTHGVTKETPVETVRTSDYRSTDYKSTGSLYDLGQQSLYGLLPFVILKEAWGGACANRWTAHRRAPTPEPATHRGAVH
jgi:hypothetical protein